MPEKSGSATRREQILHYAKALVSADDKLQAAKQAEDRAEVKKQETAKHQGYLDLEKVAKRREPP